MITSDAITVSWTMIRMLLGMWLRSKDIERFESAHTATTAAHITSAVDIFVVTASAEQIPST
jgi:hypothetical protein